MFVFRMRRIYNSMTCNELSGFGVVPLLRSVLIGLGVCVPVAGCATVSVYEPATAVVSLTEGQSRLQEASLAYSRDVRLKGLASGEASLASLADMLAGKQSDANAYWRRIGADRFAPAAVVTRVRDDMSEAALGLTRLNEMARALIDKGDLRRDDVASFESALIHARQSRDSFSDALAQVNRRSESEYQIALELAPLDAALARARLTADDLAAARAEAETPMASGS